MSVRNVAIAKSIFALTFVLGVVDGGLRPPSASGCLCAHGVLDQGRLPLPVHLLVPVVGLLGLGVGDHLGLVLKPTVGHASAGVHDGAGFILVPVVRLRGVRI